MWPIMKKGFVGRRKELRILQKDFMSDVKRAAIIYGSEGWVRQYSPRALHWGWTSILRACSDEVQRSDQTWRDTEQVERFPSCGQESSNLTRYSASLFRFEAKTAMLVNILNQKRFLIILDNFEDCLDESRSNIANPDLKMFIQHLLNNTISNSKFIITTR